MTKEEILFYIKDMYLSPDVDGKVAEILRDTINRLEQKYEGYYISKEEVLKILNKNSNNKCLLSSGLMIPEHYRKDIYYYIEKLPSVQLVRTRAKWITSYYPNIHRCSNCNATCNGSLFTSNLKYCYSCGAEMEGLEE